MLHMGQFLGFRYNAKVFSPKVLSKFIGFVEDYILIWILQNQFKWAQKRKTYFTLIKSLYVNVSGFSLSIDEWIGILFLYKKKF